MISAKDPFLGSGFGAESLLTVRLVSVRDGKALLAEADDEDGFWPSLSWEVGRCAVEAGLDVPWNVVEGLLLRLLVEPFVGRGDGLGEFPLVREGALERDSVRGVFAGGASRRGSSAALRLGMMGLGREPLVGEGNGCSPEMDANRSPI